MDMSEYGSVLFIKPDDVRDGPRRAVITAVEIDTKYNKPLLHFDDGTLLSANKTNVSNLIKGYGSDSDDWLGMEVELVLGATTYNNTKQESVLVAPIPVPRSANDGNKPAAKKKVPKSDGDDMDDDIPF